MVFYNLFDKLTLTKKFHHEVRSFLADTVAGSPDRARPALAEVDNEKCAKQITFLESTFLNLIKSQIIWDLSRHWLDLINREQGRSSSTFSGDHTFEMSFTLIPISLHLRTASYTRSVDCWGTIESDNHWCHHTRTRASQLIIS